jgi:hypothetical protein
MVQWLFEALFKNVVVIAPEFFITALRFRNHGICYPSSLCCTFTPRVAALVAVSSNTLPEVSSSSASYLV